MIPVLFISNQFSMATKLIQVKKTVAFFQMLPLRIKGSLVNMPNEDMF